MFTIVRALAEVALIVAVQAWMLVQVSFGYWRLCARARRAAATPVAAAPLPGDALLSVVIPAYREAATIEATLRRVLSAAADPRRVEVVVVDAGGGDGLWPRVLWNAACFLAGGAAAHAATRARRPPAAPKGFAGLV